MNKKITSIINENILYAFRENILLGPILIFILLLGVFSLIGNSAILSDLRHISYISVMGNIQYFLGLLLIIYLSISSFDKDIKTKNIYILLQHVNKKEYFLGKLISIFILSGLINVIFLTIFTIGYIINFKEINIELFYIFGFQQLEFLVVSFLVALTSFLFTKNIGRILIILLFLVLGHTLSYLKALVDRGILELNGILEYVVNGMYYFVPNLASLNVKSRILLDTDLLIPFIYGIMYSIVLIFILYKISMYIFQKRDF